MKALNKETAKKTLRPERIIQFGEGNFLRAFVDWIICNMNEKTDFNSSVVVVQPIGRGRIDVLQSQDCLYHVNLQGLENGRSVNSLTLIDVISRALNPYSHYEEFIKLAEQPEMRFVISNTTEAGIAFDPSCKLDDAPASSYPGKLTQLLYHRYKTFNGDMSSSVESREQLFADYIDTAVECFASETPILFNRGNHETRGVHADLLPEYFPKGEGTFYALRRYGDVCLLTLDCGEDKPDSDIEYAGLADYDAYRLEQREWLAEALRSEAFRTAATRIVLLHVPPTNGTWHGNLHIKELVGHEHRYSFHEAGEGDARFPILVNDNKSCVCCEVVQGKISLQITGAGGEVLHTHEIETKGNR